MRGGAVGVPLPQSSDVAREGVHADEVMPWSVPPLWCGQWLERGYALVGWRGRYAKMEGNFLKALFRVSALSVSCPTAWFRGAIVYDSTRRMRLARALLQPV